ncbi:MAG TPA: sphingomyelin phosphodiesterase [Chitinophagales bacterium]
MTRTVLSFLMLLAVITTKATDNDSTALNNRDLKILSWNIYMLPGIVPIAGRVKRAEAIADTLKKSDYDIIVFQEAFHRKAIGKIREGLNVLYPYMYGPFNQPTSKFKINSGVWVVSKIPLKELGVIQFGNGKVADKIAQKGAALLEGIANGKTFQILGTHVQAQQFPSIRKEQYEQIYAQLLNVYRKEGVPQIICGDMNTEMEFKDQYENMLKTFDAENGDISGIQKFTYDGTKNALAEKVWKKDKTTLDYILLRKNGATVRSVYREISVLRKKWKKHKSDLSDHYGMICEVKF